ncbi:MAG: type VI secretion system baseplate subunit TssG [bacterium]
MATGKRARPDDLTHYAQLQADPQSYHLFQALRVIEAHFAASPRLGQSRRSSQDKVRLGQEAELAFPTSTIAAFGADKQGVMRLINRSFGLFGPQGPLPLHMTEYVRNRRRNERDTTFLAFADMFTHRLMSLFYRSWAAGQPAPSFDRPGQDTFERRVAALSGYNGAGFENRDEMPDMAKRHFAGHLAAGTRTAEGLVSILSAFFAAPVHLQQFIGAWLDLEPDDRWQLGRAAGLGRSTSIGTRVWSRASKFRILVGPLTLPDYKRLLPGQGSLERLEAIVRNHVGDSLDWDVNLILRAADVPRAALGGANSALGQTTWVGMRRDRTHDANDLYLSPPHVLARQRPIAANNSPGRKT